MSLIVKNHCYIQPVVYKTMSTRVQIHLYIHERQSRTFIGLVKHFVLFQVVSRRQFSKHQLLKNIVTIIIIVLISSFNYMLLLPGDYDKY